MRHAAPYFKRTTDMSMLLLSEGCKGLESVRLGGFSKVSYAGFASILNSCLSLKKFEVQNGVRLTDLAFQDFSKVPRSLVEVKLVSCNSITSRAVCELATCSTLKVLDLHGCKSVSDSGLDNVSRLTLLTSLNLGGTSVTDVGMTVLGKGNAPISCLSLRGCRSVSDEGIISLLQSEGKIRKTLSSLDLGNMPELTDRAYRTVSRPFFRGIRWIGIGWTRLVHVDVFAENFRERKWLTICSYGCEVGCHDGWQDHEFSY
ncbi:putative leucine-rich repeat domain superfamily [Helianthus annuus]|nr:putative leucine-rich repeat domain superfamily [Helianthus annuus]